MTGFKPYFTILLALPCLFPVSSAAAGGADIAKEKCLDCHGKDGSKDSKVPNIAGFSFIAISDALIAYKNGDRKADRYTPENGAETDMSEILEDLNQTDIEALADYYSSLKFKPQKQDSDAGLAGKGAKIHKKSCEKCHSEGGSNAEDDTPILAGQWMPYLKGEFGKFTTGMRTMPKKMKRKFKKLSNEDKEALLHYYASQN